MSDLLAMSFDMPTSPALTLKGVGRTEAQAVAADLPSGWGMGWYPVDEPAAVVIRDPTSSGDSAMSRVLRDWERFRSSTFLCHLRGAAQRVTQRDTHPFIRTLSGRQWLLAHNGALEGDWAAALPLGQDESFWPIGRTDTEHAFCWLLLQIKQAKARTLAECGWLQLYTWLQRINALGTCNLILSDGQSLVAYRDARGYAELHWVRITPPDLRGRLESEAVALDLDGVRDSNRTGLIVATRPLSPQQRPWVAMGLGQMLAVRRGTVVWDSLCVWDPPPQPVSHGVGEALVLQSRPEAPPHPMPLQQAQSPRGPAPMAAPPADGAGPLHPCSPGQPLAGAYSPPVVAQGQQPASRVLRVRHDTVYRYASPVESSTHLLRLRPVQDAGQQLVEYRLEISVDGLRREYEDVFGNHALRLEIATPYTELAVRALSRVALAAQPELDLRRPTRRDQIPLVWMPWQRQMMLPYLLPAELAESELQELHDFAMSFVERNDYELLGTLLDINRTLFKDFTYISGSTTLSTTPFQVYVSRRGVCQDFANLLICLARLLNVPARYRAGYIYTGGSYENRVQSDASHAWAELYLPWFGWRGFDPTNGTLVQLDHVRVACGRNFQDATPTSGTIFRGGGNETLAVDVKVELEA